MIKNILNLEKVTVLKKEQQKSINGGFWGCQPEFRECRTDRDCPCGGCGMYIEGIGLIEGLCAY